MSLLCRVVELPIVVILVRPDTADDLNGREVAERTWFNAGKDCVIEKRATEQ